MVVEGSKKITVQPKVAQDKGLDLVESEITKDTLALEQSLSALSLKPSSDSQSPSRLTEREAITLVVLGRMLEEKLVTESLATSFLVHTALIGSIPLHSRRQSTRNQDREQSSQTTAFFADFSNLSTSLLSEDAWAGSMEAGTVHCDIFDLVDGRLMEAVMADRPTTTYTSEVTLIFEKLERELFALSGTHLKVSGPRETYAPVTQTAIELNSNDITILPFSNPVFDKHLASLNLRAAPSKGSDRLSGRLYQEVSHWHNVKKRLDPKHSQITPASEKEKFRALRRNQFFMAEMQGYAASLTNAAGKALEPDIVTVSATTYPEINKDVKGPKPVAVKPQKGKPAPNKKGGAKKAMLEDIATNKAIKDSENDEKTFSAWKTVRKNLESERQLQSKYLKIKAYLRDLPDAKRAVVQAEVEYHLLCVLYEMYRILGKAVDMKAGTSSTEELSGVAALIWETIRRLATIDGLTKTIADRLTLVLKALYLPDPGVPAPSIDRKLAYDPEIVLPKGDELSVRLDGRLFQLLHCGPYMDRNLDSAPDSRVPFQPDGWQRRVLDELDAQNSVFVVAPTSAGKTFISFYAMEKVLRGNDDSVLVYVAPTKALVNQIAAEVQARFKKTYKHAGKSVWAMYVAFPSCLFSFLASLRVASHLLQLFPL